MFKFNLGDVLRDKITGFIGVVMARSDYFTGCRHCALQAQKVNKDGKVPDWEWLDEMRLERVSGRKAISFVSAPGKKVKGPGGPSQNPPTIN